MLPVHSFLCIVLTSLVSLCFCREEFRCKAVAGCEIARCDPSPLSWVHLGRNEFPISCVSDNVGKETGYENEVKMLKSKVKDLTEELNVQNEDIKSLKEQIRELKVQNEDMKEMKERIRELQQYNKVANNTATPHLAATLMPSATPSLTTTANGWTVFQRRQDGSVSFDRTWTEYVNGFGREGGEFWIGLEKLHEMTSKSHHELRIELGDWEGNTAYARYSKFSVESAFTKYRLRVSGYSGTAGDSLSHGGSRAVHNGMAFSTYDSDNDKYYTKNCGELAKSGWWFNQCTQSNLNGIYHHGGKYTAAYDDGIVWQSWKNDFFYSMKFVEMKLRPEQ